MMKKKYVLSIALGFTLGSHAAHAAVTFDWVTIGNAGNGADINGRDRGAVAYTFRMSTYEVTNAQYAQFLNAVDPAGTNALGLYNVNMTDNGVGGILFNSGAADGAKYAIKPDRVNNPVVYVSFQDSMRFTNWLENGQGSGGTETGVYTIGTGTSEVRNPTATYFIPNADEWHKAAFHKNDGVTANYWLYATSSDTAPYSDQPPGNGAPDPSNTANFLLDDVNDLNGYNDGYAVTGSPVLVAGQNYLSDVGAYGATLNPYGLYDMGGNAYEWNEQAFDNFGRRDIAGGSWARNEGRLASSALTGERTNLLADGTDRGFNHIGFRIASAVPEPESYAMLLAGLGLLGIAARRRKRKLID